MITMRISPQVTERVKEAPAQALRAVFSGIGQVLLVADRIKTRAAEPDRAHPPAAASQDAAAPRDETRWRSLDETGNVRLLSEADATPASPAANGPANAAKPETAPETEPPSADVTPVSEPDAAAGSVAAAEPTAATEPTGTPEPTAAAPTAAAESAPAAETAEPGEPALPVPNYDDLTVASLRARLRNLDQSQVRVLLEYEKAHAGRAAVLTMFERRIAKLESNEA
jgi:cytoskeletal protein RodZ